MNLKTLQDQSWIDDEADFVDEVILLVGKRKNTNRALTDSFSREFVLLLANPELQQPLAPATPVTPEGWVEFAGNFFTGLTIPHNVLTSKQVVDNICAVSSVYSTGISCSLNWPGLIWVFCLLTFHFFISRV